MGALNPSRRGLLGLIAHAPVVAIVAGAPVQSRPVNPSISGGEYDPIEHIARMNRTVAEMERKLSVRPVNGERGLNLRTAHCELGCSPCRMECAVLPQRIA